MSDIPRRVMRLKEVMHVSGLGRSSIYNYMNNGKFPKCRPLGGGIVGWSSVEVQEWVDARLDGRDWQPGDKTSDLLEQLASDIEQHPERLRAVDTALVERIKALVSGVDVDICEPLSPDDE